MEKRLLLAIILMTAAILLTNLLFPPPEPSLEQAEETADSVVASTPAATPTASSMRAEAPLPIRPVSVAAADTVVVESELYRYYFSTRGAQLVRAELLDYPSYVNDGSPVQVVPPGDERFLKYSVTVGEQAVPFASFDFAPSARSVEVDGDAVLTFTHSDSAGFGAVVEYHFREGSYLIQTSGRVEGLGSRSGALEFELGPRLEEHDALDHRSETEFAVVGRWPGNFDRYPFRSIDASRELDPNPTWVGIKDKYFLAVVIASEERPLTGATAVRLEDATHMVQGDEITMPQVDVATSLPLEEDGSFAFSLYVGPQDFNRLAAIGYDLEEVTPYGYRWIQPIIRPFAAAVLWVLNSLHQSLGIAYGWVLVIFGVMMRTLLWPLNAKAMRAQMKNMAVQPLMQEIREKFKNDPQKQQEAMLTLYKEHGFNPFAGCLPMLLPFPVLITLFFVFRNTIAFRGAEFLWLPDLSLRDPLYILPLILVVSMFGLQFVSARMSGMEQNPQMKMMMYFMPLMMGGLFFMFPAGLNIYYSVNQLASFPQQILIARERKRAQDEIKASGGPKLPGGRASRRSSKGKR